MMRFRRQCVYGNLHFAERYDASIADTPSLRLSASRHAASSSGGMRRVMYFRTGGSSACPNRTPNSIHKEGRCATRSVPAPIHPSSHCHCFESQLREYQKELAHFLKRLSTLMPSGGASALSTLSAMKHFSIMAFFAGLAWLVRSGQALSTLFDCVLICADC
jgi:hypothetical protein